MNRNMSTVEALYRHASTAIIDTSDNKLQHFIVALQEIYNDSDEVSLFRTLHHTRIRLCAEFDNRSQPLFESVISYINTELELLARYGCRAKSLTTPFRWTGSLVELVEVIYAFDEIGCINDGQTDIKDLVSFFGSQFGLEIKVRNCYDAYLDMKRRKNESRTYFLDKLCERLNLRMQRDDEKERMRR